MRKISIIVFSLLLSPLSHGKILPCNKFLNSDLEQIGTVSVTDNFISYLSMLLNQQVLDLSELEAFVMRLEQDHVLVHPFSGEIFNRMDRQIHQLNLQSYIDQSQKLDEIKILQWAKHFLDTTKKVRIKRTESENETKSPYLKMRFLPIDFTKLIQHPKITLNRSIEVMQTLVTQKMWKEEMSGENPTSFEENGDHPIENITLWSAMEFANRVSRREGLKPFYNLDHIQWNGSVEKGIRTYTNEEQVHKIFEALNGKNVDEEEGYRFPTLDEAYVLYYHFYRNLKGTFTDEVWCNANSKNQIHDVTMGPSGARNMNEFVDMVGHLFIRTNDLHKVRDTTNNYEYQLMSMGVGGSWNTQPGEFEVNSFDSDPPIRGLNSNSVSRMDGIRLVRTIIKSKGSKP